MHIDFNSYFAGVEQQANPRLRNKPIGVTGGDRMKRTVLGAASIEAKKFGVKTGMQVWQAKKLCPNIIIVPGDSNKYLETTKRFLTILKDCSPYLEVFSIDEAFLELPQETSLVGHRKLLTQPNHSLRTYFTPDNDLKTSSSKTGFTALHSLTDLDLAIAVETALNIKKRIKLEIGEWITCSVGISYNKLIAKLAGSLQKPNGLVIIANQEKAIKVLDKIELDEICGIGPGIKKRLNNMGIFNFYQLRQAPLESLLASFKSYGQILYNIARGIDYSKIVPFYEKGEVKSIGHRHTTDHDTNDPNEIKQILLKLTELVARRLRAKNLMGKTIHCWRRSTLHDKNIFSEERMQITVPNTNNGLEIFKTAWKIFQNIWRGEDIRMIGISISNLSSTLPRTLSLLPEVNKQEIMLQTIDTINNKYGEFTLQRGSLLTSPKIHRRPNPFLSDRRFKL